jgi:hypothetical protein
MSCKLQARANGFEHYSCRLLPAMRCLKLSWCGERMECRIIVCSLHVLRLTSAGAVPNRSGKVVLDRRAKCMSCIPRCSQRWTNVNLHRACRRKALISKLQPEDTNEVQHGLEHFNFPSSTRGKALHIQSCWRRTRQNDQRNNFTQNMFYWDKRAGKPTSYACLELGCSVCRYKIIILATSPTVENGSCMESWKWKLWVSYLPISETDWAQGPHKEFLRSTWDEQHPIPWQSLPSQGARHGISAETSAISKQSRRSSQREQLTSYCNTTFFQPCFPSPSGPALE